MKSSAMTDENGWLRIIRAFEKSKSEWRVAAPFIKPAAGDLHMVHVDGDVIVVEVERCAQLHYSDILTKRAVMEQWIGYHLGEHDRLALCRKGAT